MPNEQSTMYTHLKERSYYEDLYDRNTVSIGRRNQHYYDRFLKDFVQGAKQSTPPIDLKRPGNIALINFAYMKICGYELLSRHEQREQTIAEWMERDRARDQRIADTKLKHDPPCQHCGKLGLECNYKTFLQRDQNEEIVLLMFRCDNCHKNSAYWEDGAPYKVNHDDELENYKITTKPNSPKKRTPKNHDIEDINDPYYWNIDPEHDPDYAKDRYEFCLYNEQELKELREMQAAFTKLGELGRELTEERRQKSINQAVEQIKKLTVSEVIKELEKSLQKQGYDKLEFATPQIGRNLTLEFNCLDTNPKRKEYQSIRELKRAIDKKLLLTNWRLMSDGIHYRLGFLFGRLKAIEDPDDLKKLAKKLLQSGKIKLPKESETKKSDKNDPAYTEVMPDGTVIQL